MGVDGGINVLIFEIGFANIADHNEGHSHYIDAKSGISSRSYSCRKKTKTQTLKKIAD
jgi:hypothetical protein